MTETAADRFLALDPAGPDEYEAFIPDRGMPRLFGGQVAAQALLAASRTVDDHRPVHSLHAYFVRGGRPGVPLRYSVDRTRDGRSFTTRHVTAHQDGHAIFELLASFQHPEAGPDWQQPGPPIGEVPPPPAEGHGFPFLTITEHLDIRRADPAPPTPATIFPLWIRAHRPLGEDPAVHAALATFVSDLGIMAVCKGPGTTLPVVTTASLDHAVWFHRAPCLDDWLIYTAGTIANIGARGLARGSFHTRHGELVATITQEALLRTGQGDTPSAFDRFPSNPTRDGTTP
jgi:acyl-CoA thioesterase II